MPCHPVELLYRYPDAYRTSGFVVRCFNTLLSLALVAQLAHYYTFLHKRAPHPPGELSFFDAPRFRWSFALEAAFVANAFMLVGLAARYPEARDQ